jgi:hypothetical protein
MLLSRVAAVAIGYGTCAAANSAGDAMPIPTIRAPRPNCAPVAISAPPRGSTVGCSRTKSRTSALPKGRKCAAVGDWINQARLPATSIGSTSNTHARRPRVTQQRPKQPRKQLNRRTLLDQPRIHTGVSPVLRRRRAVFERSGQGGGLDNAGRRRNFDNYKCLSARDLAIYTRSDARGPPDRNRSGQPVTLAARHLFRPVFDI